MRNMHIDGFAKALAAFDAEMDEFARNQRKYSLGWSSTEEPLEEGKDYTISYVYPSTHSKTCGCGDSCNCAGKATTNVRFDDILDDIKQVVFNDPATIVWFSDGSKVCVKACEKDTFNKETGILYALVKRLYANDIDENSGYLKSKGLGEKIAKIVANATDQKEVERERRRKLKQKQKAKCSDEKAKMANEVSEQAAKEACEQVYGNDVEKK